MNIAIEISPTGRVAMLYSDEVDLSDFGKVEISRVSRVEPDSDASWYVRSAMTGEIISSGFTKRSAALAYEKLYYSPTGPGWPEIIGD